MAFYKKGEKLPQIVGMDGEIIEGFLEDTWPDANRFIVVVFTQNGPKTKIYSPDSFSTKIDIVGDGLEILEI